MTLAFALASTTGASAVFAKRSADSAEDIAATRTYLRAAHRYEQAVDAARPTGEAALRALVDRVDGQCPNVLAGAPASKATEAILREADFEAYYALQGLPRNATIVFAKTVQRLHWSNHKLTYYARGDAAEARANAELVAPNLCIDARTVIANDFKTVPASSTRYAHEAFCANSKVSIEGEAGGLDEIIQKLLKPYELPSERNLRPRHPNVHRQKAERQRLEVAEKEVTDALGLREPERPAPLAVRPACTPPPPPPH